MRHSVRSNFPLSQSRIEQYINALEPYFRDITDDLPLIDIIISKNKRPSLYRSSVAVFLPEKTFLFSATNRSASRATWNAFNLLLPQVQKYFQTSLKQTPFSPRIAI